MKGTTKTIARFASNFDSSSLSDRHIRECGRALADTYAVAVAGLREPSTQRALQYILRYGGSGICELWGSSHKTSIESAALFNGIAGHALDYDDASSPMSGHPSIVLLPALLAIGEAHESSGRELAAAFAIGFEVACRLGRGLSQTHYDRGWHLTASIGTVASAAACARLLGLTEDQTSHAIGLALAQASGTRASFGTDAKPFQAGHASACGARAALLAQTGFTAAADAFAGTGSFTSLYSDGEDLAAAFHGIGDEPLELDKSGIEIKKYPACYAVHRPLDGLFDLKAQFGFLASDVSHVSVETSYGALAPLITKAPRTGAEARFSMQYALATALVQGEVTLSSFTDEAILDKEIGPLMEKIEASEAAGSMTPRWAKIEVSLRDGRVLNKSVEVLRGAPQQPLSDARLAEKVADCLQWGQSSIQAGSLMDSALSLKSLSIPQLLSGITATV